MSLALTSFASAFTRACTAYCSVSALLVLEPYTMGPDTSQICRYDDLRTNLPREFMSFSDFPFIPEALGSLSVDPRRFPHHEEVPAQNTQLPCCLVCAYTVHILAEASQYARPVLRTCALTVETCLCRCCGICSSLR